MADDPFGANGEVTDTTNRAPLFYDVNPRVTLALRIYAGVVGFLVFIPTKVKRARLELAPGDIRQMVRLEETPRIAGPIPSVYMVADGRVSASPRSPSLA